ncbi:hypothetical protein [Bifidobacterium moraviense]|uniref:hypothetical protein n=1 Tax=Bifidobacterium moraviense TaxID=2675323 RepID=UPI00145DD2EB|nr:hypothetical protein [Bifidobacterium sp. DSM 109958]
MKSFKGEGGITVTDAMLEDWGEAAERGDYPGESAEETFHIGVPPTDAQVAAGAGLSSTHAGKN